MADDTQEPDTNQIPVEPEDPEYQIEEHILARRKDQINKANFQALVSQNVSQLSKVFDGTTYAFVKLQLVNKGLSSIPKTIVKYPHLRYINIDNNLLTSIAPLASLKYVVQLSLAKNLVSEINCLSNDENFPHVVTLNLSGNKLKRLTSVYIKKIKHLNANNNQIEDVTDFDGSKTLQTLELRGNLIEDVSRLAHFPKLKNLYLANNKITDFSGLRQMDNLQRLHLRKNKISHIEKPPALPNLTYLNLRENLIAKVEGLGGVSESVKVLNVLGCPISQELADNTKKEVWMLYRQFHKINKSEVTAEEKSDFDKQYKEKLAQKERERLEKEAAERQAAGNQPQ